MLYCCSIGMLFRPWVQSPSWKEDNLSPEELDCSLCLAASFGIVTFDLEEGTERACSKVSIVLD